MHVTSTSIIRSAAVLAFIASMTSCTKVHFEPAEDMPTGARVLLIPEPIAREISLGIVFAKWNDTGESLAFDATRPTTEYFFFGDADRNYKLWLCLPQQEAAGEHLLLFTPSQVDSITLSPMGVTAHQE